MQNNHEHVTATEALKQDFAEWRKTRRPRSRIPEDLWARAAEMAAEIGIHKTARALRLDYTALKKRVVVDTPVLAPSDAAAFVEWLSPLSATISECSMQVESVRGARMRLELKNIAPQGLASIIREFAG